MKLLHIGCGNRRHEGFINTDKDEMDITKPWPHEDDSVDGIVSIAVIQCLNWEELIFAFQEAFRVLKPGGVMRIGCMLVETNWPNLYLYGNNINLFSYDLLHNILVNRVGFTWMRPCRYKEVSILEFADVDYRQNKGLSYVEVVK